MQEFSTGATRNIDTNKFDYEGFICPEVLHAFGEYMHEHRRQKDGSIRDSDNWQKGIPLRTYIKSLVRHVIDLWRMERGFAVTNPDTGLPHTKIELCAAIMFNVMGYAKETLQPSAINQSNQREEKVALVKKLIENAKVAMDVEHDKAMQKVEEKFLEDRAVAGLKKAQQVREDLDTAARDLGEKMVGASLASARQGMKL
jgi:hypothetical protein